MIRNRLVAAGVGGLLLASGIAAGAPAQAATTATAAPAAVKYVHYANCKALNAKYKHGVGRKGARDHVKGKTKPVKNFYVNTGLYNANTKLDRDKDGVACEKR